MDAVTVIQIIFCADPFNPREPDPAYEAEVRAARDLGLACHLIGFEALVDEQDAARAVRRVPEQAEPVLALYRGWMLRPERYGDLFQALAARGLALINDPAVYALCHELPRWYPLLTAWTPRSAWLATTGAVSDDDLANLARPFGSSPLIVKDYVKSRKHDWDEACFISDASNLPVVARVARRFLELQGPDLYGGLVLREFEAFEPLATHSRSGMPLTREYRLFCLDGEPIVSAEYWEEGDYEQGDDGGAIPPLDDLRALAGLVPSRFFTMDVARRIDGLWRVVELGDGQVAGLPERIDPAALYGALADRLSS